MFFQQQQIQTKNYTFKIYLGVENRNKDFSINWEILARTKNKFSLKHGFTLCNMEKHKISKLNPNRALNKQNELFSKCKHFSSFYFK